MGLYRVVIDYQGERHSSQTGPKHYVPILLHDLEDMLGIDMEEGWPDPPSKEMAWWVEEGISVDGRVEWFSTEWP